MEHRDEGNAAQIAYWNERAGETWTTEQERIDATFEGVTEAALAAAEPSDGERVLDIGCGCGATTLALARRVGPTGRVTGLDVSAPMAGRARERLAQAGLANAEVVIGDAAEQAFAAADTDLLFSRFGVMFFADPVAAFANLRRALRPGGRLLFAAWAPLARNPWFVVPLQAGAAFLPAQPPGDPEAPGPFAFADAGRVRAILDRAGWREADAELREVPMRIAGPGELAEAARFATRVGPLARALAEVEDPVRERVRTAVGEALRPYDGPDGIVLPGTIWLVRATS